MNWEVPIITGAVLIFFLTLIGLVSYGDYQDHQVQMQCVKEHGLWIDKSCIFKDQP